MNCLLWEDQFYEDGVAIADRIEALVPKVTPETVAALAIEAREEMKLRHAPLLVVREMARHATHRGARGRHARAHHPASRRADRVPRDLLGGRARPDAAAQAPAGLGAGQEGPGEGVRRSSTPISSPSTTATAPVRLRDVLFLVHAKPKDAAQEKVWKQLVDGTLPSPDTWEVALSAGRTSARRSSA